MSTGIFPDQGRDVRQRAVNGFFGLICLLALIYLFVHVRTQNGWVLGDWVIDYRQGFVRRGLAGAALSPLAHMTGLPITVWVAVLLSALYGATLYGFSRVLAERHKPFWYLLLLLSPAGLVFNVYGSAEVGRKELMHFFELSLFVWLLASGRLSARWAPAFFVLALAGALMHEMLFFYVPYFFLAAAWGGRARGFNRPAYLVAAAAAAGSGCGFLAVALMARPFDGQAFCDSLMREQGLSSTICQGTITWPIQTLSESLADTALAINAFQYPLVYGAALLLALLPVLFWLRRYERATVRRTLLGLCGAVLFSLPLFWVAVDWGRFIQIHLVSSAMVLALRLRRRGESSQQLAGQAGQQARPPSAPRVAWRRPWARQAALVCTVGLYLAWNMPVCCQASVGMGAIEKLGKAQGFVALMWHRLPY